MFKLLLHFWSLGHECGCTFRGEGRSWTHSQCTKTSCTLQRTYKNSSKPLFARLIVAKDSSERQASAHSLQKTRLHWRKMHKLDSINILKPPSHHWKLKCISLILKKPSVYKFTNMFINFILQSLIVFDTYLIIHNFFYWF